MVQVQHLFDTHDETGQHNNRVHIGEMVGIGEMVSLFGPPPMEMQRLSTNSWRIFDDKGDWIT